MIASLNMFILQAQEESGLSSDSPSTQTYIGVKGGVNLPSLSYSNSGLNDYKSELYTTTMWGIFAEIPLNQDNTFSIRPEVNFITRGQHIKDQGIVYAMDVQYRDVYLPFVYTFRGRELGVSPFLLVAPTVGFATGGNIKLDNWKVKVSDGNLNPVSYGLYAGAGIKIPVVSNHKETFSIGLEVGYYLGLSDTYSEKEIDGESQALNVNFYEIDGTRKHTGFQAQVSVAIPLSVFKQQKKAVPVVQPVAPPVIVQEVVREVEKPCYTLEEMRELIREKKNITGKIICAMEQITFEFGKSNLSQSSQDYLNQIVVLMQENQVMKITVNGHTDNVGSADFNMNLSKTRAEAVYNYLVKSGISSSRLSFRYFGMTRPIADNDTEEGRAMNRRVEFEIINQ